MSQPPRYSVERRKLLKALAVVPLGAAVLPACGTSTSADARVLDAAAGGPHTDAGASDDALARDTLPLEPTPACGDRPTLAQTEGPYWRPSSPERAVLVPAGATGERLVLEGFVVTRACAPIAQALVDLWHCDAAGVYDNSGFSWRGHVFAGADGRYRFETIVPGVYPGRTRHFHVKVRPPGGTVLTTQLYFPGDTGNARDGIYDARLLLTRRDPGNASFTFVVG